MTTTDAWADWINPHTGDERYQNIIKLICMMIVFSSNCACCERSGSGMSIIKTKGHKCLADSTVMYLQLMYTYRLHPERLDWDTVVSRFLNKKTNMYFDHFYESSG